MRCSGQSWSWKAAFDSGCTAGSSLGGVDITPYIGLARRIASKYHHRLRIPFDDLLGPALEGLVQASMSFRAEKGSSFYGHAERRIMGSIQDYLRSLDTVTRAESRAGVERATMHPIEDAFGLADASPDAQVRYLHAELIHDVVAEMEALPAAHPRHDGALLRGRAHSQRDRQHLRLHRGPGLPDHHKGPGYDADSTRGVINPGWRSTRT